MSYLGPQQLQPVPIFYGEITATSVNIALTTGFDWVLTSITSESGNTTPLTQQLRDESGVQLFVWQVPGAAGTGGLGIYTWDGFRPIGPRTALTLISGATGGVTLISGYAVSPPTALHV